MDFMRRCAECGRILHGHAGNACPYCGGARLESVELRTDAPVYKHSSILTAVLTFCIGLLLLCALFSWLSPNFAFATQNYGQMLWRLQSVVAAGTLFYLILRRSEGDFRALFCVALALFAIGEGLGAVVRFYGVLTLGSLTSLVGMALCIFSSLALSASFADGPRRDGYARILSFVTSGMMFMAAMRVFYDMRLRDVDVRGNRLIAGVLGFLALVVGVSLFICWMKERQARQKLSDATAKSQPMPTEDPRLDASK